MKLRPVNNAMIIEPIKEKISDRFIVGGIKESELVKAKVIETSNDTAKAGDIILTNKNLFMEVDLGKQRITITGVDNIHAVL